jgi:hypothetical protein
MKRSLCLLSGVLLLTACAVAPTRPANSSYGCMQAVHTQLTAIIDDKQQHCLASALIAQQCSLAEAYLAGLGKELRDFFGKGDAAWSDWQADLAGITCAKNNNHRPALEACCRNTARQVRQ